MGKMIKKCPICGQRLEFESPEWTFNTARTEGHLVLTMGSARNARADIRQAAEFQMAANRAAYNLDFDACLNLGFLGEAWVQCPCARERVGGIATEKK